MKTAIYPGSFDPITFGHIDIVERSCALFDKVILGVAGSKLKDPLFNVDERIELIEAIFKDNSKIEVIGYSDKFTKFFANRCNSYSTAYILNPEGFHYFKSSKNILGGNSCDKLILVMQDHYDQSEIIKWVLEKNYKKTNMSFKDYQIWSSNEKL